MSKIVLVTGANGFIGTEVVRKLEANGWNVLSAVREAKFANEVKCDLTDLDSIENIKLIKKPEAIIHLATAVGFGAETLDDLYLPNVEATSSLIELAEEWNALFIFASAALIAGLDKSFIEADSIDNPQSAYMESKLLAENLIKLSKIKSCILRIGGVYGLNGPNHLALNRAIVAVINGESPVQIGMGTAKRNYLYVKDVAEIICCALEKQVVGTHLIAGKEILSIAEMLQTLCHTFAPDKSPIVKRGQEAKDQVIIPSLSLPATFSFSEAVDDMFREANK